jgi:uncharacterized membrane protein YeaQ/YmgE (transglycosylase-associated protein family)
MEGFLEALGFIGLVVLVVVGLVAGWIASAASGGRDKGRYMAIGVVAAVATPFVLAILGVTALAAAGLVAILFAALIGAVIVLVIVNLVLDRR